MEGKSRWQYDERDGLEQRHDGSLTTFSAAG
jgi:hypothetical protein